MTKLKTAAEIRELIANKRASIRSNVDLTAVYEKINDRLENIPLGTTSLRILAKTIRSDVDIPDEEWMDSVQFILDTIQFELGDRGFTVRPKFGLGFGQEPPRIGLVIYWDPKDLPDEEVSLKDAY